MRVYSWVSLQYFKSFLCFPGLLMPSTASAAPSTPHADCHDGIFEVLEREHRQMAQLMAQIADKASEDARGPASRLCTARSTPSLLSELRAMATHGETWVARFKVLKESVEHHVEEEEETMFPKGRKLLSVPEAEALAQAFERARDAHLASLGAPP